MDNMINTMLELLKTMLEEDRPYKIRMVLRETIKHLEDIKEVNGTAEWKLQALSAVLQEQTLKIKEISKE